MIPNDIVLVVQNHDSLVERDIKNDHGTIGFLGAGRAWGGGGGEEGD